MFPEKIRSAVVLALRFLFLTRYSWLLAIVLLGLPPLALLGAPPLLENLFVLDRPVQMFHVSWITIFCATSVITTLRITTLNAPDRFDDYRQASQDFQAAWGISDVGDRLWFRRPEVWFMLGLGLAASLAMWYSVVSACVAKTASDPGPAWGQFMTEALAETSVTAMAWREALAGLAVILAALLAVYLVVTIHDVWFAKKHLEDQAYRYTPGKRVCTTRPSVEVDEQPYMEFLTYLLGPGYFRAVIVKRGDQERETITLAPGHAGLMICTSLFFSWYGFNYWSCLQNSHLPDASSYFPALFFGLLSLLLLIFLLPGVAFFLDRHRIPLEPTLLFMMATLYCVFDTDHVYDLNPEPRRVAAVTAPAWHELLARRPPPVDGDGRRTLVVVDASGGGIQASAWTAQVLTGLHELYGDTFSRSVRLISAVSGGSVGTMFYLVHRGELANDPEEPAQYATVLTPAAIERIRESSRASGLEATCWGIAYPDTLRAVFPPLAAETVDRGWSIEQNWRERISGALPGRDDLRLSDLSQRLRDSDMPVPVFNATLVETGQRLLISPALSPPAAGKSASRCVEFLRVFPRSHLRVSTAARLSATFPYVTPVARPHNDAAEYAADAADPLLGAHVADGAYADNEGAVTSVDWINRLLVHYSQPENADDRPFDRVLLIRIQAFPAETTPSVRESNNLAGWRAVLLGPFDAMMQVRSASQTERGDLEIQLLTRATLAEMRAAKERVERDFQMALAQVDQLESIRDELRRLATAARGVRADLERQFLEADDKLRVAREMLVRAQDQQRRLGELQVESVVFDFHPADDVRIPLSWKLTARQQRQIDRTWEQLVIGSYPHRPLEIVDRYFQRLDPAQRVWHVADERGGN